MFFPHRFGEGSDYMKSQHHAGRRQGCFLSGGFTQVKGPIYASSVYQRSSGRRPQNAGYDFHGYFHMFSPFPGIPNSRRLIPFILKAVSGGKDKDARRKFSGPLKCGLSPGGAITRPGRRRRSGKEMSPRIEREAGRNPVIIDGTLHLYEIDIEYSPGRGDKLRAPRKKRRNKYEAQA